MKKLFLFLIVSFSITNVHAQWNLINTTYFNDGIDKVYWVNTNIVFIVGMNNLIFKSTNGGLTWANKNQSINPALYGMNDFTEIKFVDSLNGFIGSTRLFQTTNGGNNWFVNSNDQYEKYQIVTGNLIFATGWGLLYVSTNKGANWVLQNFLPFGTNKIIFLDIATGYALTNTNLCKTTDEGISWFICFENSVNYALRDFSFQDFNNGILVAKHAILRTNNGGVNWTVVNSFPATNTYSEVSYFKNSDYVIVGIYNSNSNLYYSVNGVPAVYQLTLQNVQYFHAAFCNVQKGLFTMDYCKLFLINNNDQTCENVSSAGTIKENIKDMHLFDPNNIYLACDSNCFVSSNGGVSWEERHGYRFNEIKFINWYTGFAITSNEVFRTINHGESWENIPFSPQIPNSVYSKLRVSNEGGVFLNVYCSDDTQGLIYFRNQIYASFNSGNIWGKINEVSGVGNQYIDSKDWFADYQFINNSIGYALHNSQSTSFPPHGGTPTSSSGSFLMKTENGGICWTNILTINNSELGGLFFLDANTGYFTLFGSTIGGLNKTTNGGINWERISSFSSTSFQYTNYYTAYSPGWCSSNGGYNWTYQFSPLSCNGFKFANNLTGYIFGNSGFIYKTTNGGGITLGVLSESNLSPDNFFLHQNYPNPFNPSTKINYEIKQSGFVSLKVFDLLGKEVAQLVNEKQNAGSYAVDFNSTEFNLPSGIYFYTLNAGEFKETRKMVLIK